MELAKRAQILKEEADQESTHAIKNVLADISGFIGFVVIAIAGRRDLQVLRGFID